MRGLREFLQKYWLALFFAISVLYVVYYIYGQIDRLQETIEFSFLPLLASIAIQVVSWLLFGYLWAALLSLVAGKKVTLWNSLFQLCMLTLGKYIPGKIWGVVARASYAKQEHGITIGKMVQATYIEQLYVFGSGVIVAAVLAAALGINDLLWYVAALLLLALMGATFYQKPLTSLIRWSYRRHDPDAQVVLEAPNLPPLRMPSVLLLYGLGWLLLGLVMYTLYLSVFEAEPVPRMAMAIVMAGTAGYCAGLIAFFAPGGIGVREAVSGGILAGFMPLADAVLLVLIFRLWLASLDILAGGGMYLWYTRFQRAASI
ncbi:MAG: flippase-like domain-containing protein [Gammaproteobacteria bacterium]|nr:flippase-like domain-containing protein [Gammaproteobacteria bacterium]